MPFTSAIGKALGSLFRPAHGGSGVGHPQVGPGAIDDTLHDDRSERGAAHAAAGPGPGSRDHSNSGTRRRRSPLKHRTQLGSSSGAQHSGIGPKAAAHATQRSHHARAGPVAVTAAAAVTASTADTLPAADAGGKASATAVSACPLAADTASARSDATPAGSGSSGGGCSGCGGCGAAASGGSCSDAGASGGGDGGASPLASGGAPNFFRASRASLGDATASAAGEALRQASMTARKAHFTRDNLVAYMRWVRASRGVLKLAGKANCRGPHPQLLLRCEHWLEVTDTQHRYGSNLRVYFDYWVAEMEAAELTPPPSPALMSPSPSHTQLAALAASVAATAAAQPLAAAAGAHGQEAAPEGPNAASPPGHLQQQQQQQQHQQRPSRFSGETAQPSHAPHPHPIRVQPHPHLAHVHLAHRRTGRRPSAEQRDPQGPVAQPEPEQQQHSTTTQQSQQHEQKDQEGQARRSAGAPDLAACGDGMGCGAGAGGGAGFGSPCAPEGAAGQPGALSTAGADAASPARPVAACDGGTGTPLALRQLREEAAAEGEDGQRPAPRRHSCGEVLAEGAERRLPPQQQPSRASCDAVRHPALAGAASAPGSAGGAGAAAPCISPRRSNHLCSPSFRFALAAMVDMSPEAERQRNEEEQEAEREAERRAGRQRDGGGGGSADGDGGGGVDLQRAGSLVGPACGAADAAGQGLPPATPLPPPSAAAEPGHLHGGAAGVAVTPPAVAAGLALSCGAGAGVGGGGGVGVAGGAGSHPPCSSTVLRAAKLMSNRSSVGNGSNFFRWLDNGPGLDVDLAHLGVSRAKLDTERVKYLTPHELSEYELDVDMETGLLRYKRSGKLLHTGPDHAGRASIDEHRRPPTPPPPAVPLSLLGEGAAAWWRSSSSLAAAAAAPTAAECQQQAATATQALSARGSQCTSRHSTRRGGTMETVPEGLLAAAGGSGVLDIGPEPGLGPELQARLQSLAAAEGPHRLSSGGGGKPQLPELELRGHSASSVGRAECGVTPLRLDDALAAAAGEAPAGPDGKGGANAAAAVAGAAEQGGPWMARAPGPIAAAAMQSPPPRMAPVRAPTAGGCVSAGPGSAEAPCTPTPCTPTPSVLAANVFAAAAAGGAAPKTPLGAAVGAGAGRGAHEEKEKVTKWIYVVDPELRLFVHPKVRGRFHHSSFLRGGAVVAAGGLAARHGQLRLLTADSGHYWPREENFRWLCEHLVSVGADLSACELRSKHMPVPAATGRELMEKMGVPPPPWRLPYLHPALPSPSASLQQLVLAAAEAAAAAEADGAEAGAETGADAGFARRQRAEAPSLAPGRSDGGAAASSERQGAER